jgi:cell division protein FtsQ
MKSSSASKLAGTMSMVTADAHIREHLMITAKRVLVVFTAVAVLILLLSMRDRIIGWIDHPVSKMTVSGDFKHLDEQSVQKHLASFIGVGFLKTDLKALKQHVEAMPWVFSATVNRVWPGEFAIQIEEELPVSYWNDAGLLNAKGDVFLPEQLNRALPLASLNSKLAKDQQDRLEILTLLTYIEKELALFSLRPVQLEQGLRGDWVMQLDNGISVILGKVELSSGELRSLDNKLERVGKLLMHDALEKKQLIQTLDTRYPNGIAVEWKEQATSTK